VSRSASTCKVGPRRYNVVHAVAGARVTHVLEVHGYRHACKAPPIGHLFEVVGVANTGQIIGYVDRGAGPLVKGCVKERLCWCPTSIDEVGHVQHIRVVLVKGEGP
jgi:hypothetical protein